MAFYPIARLVYLEPYAGHTAFHFFRTAPDTSVCRSHALRRRPRSDSREETLERGCTRSTSSGGNFGQDIYSVPVYLKFITPIGSPAISPNVVQLKMSSASPVHVCHPTLEVDLAAIYCKQTDRYCSTGQSRMPK